MQSFFRNILIAAALLAVPLAGTAQNAAAFLSVVPDARSAAMGGAGVALSADVFSALRNAAQLPFSEERFGAGYSYLPWMRDLTPRTALHTAAVYFKPDGKQAVSASFRYFSQYGSERTDEEGNVLGRLEPHDMAFDVGYSRTVAEGLSVALTARYVRSEPGADDVAQTFAVDAGTIAIDGKDAKGFTTEQVSSRLKGEPGSKVKVTVEHLDGSTETVTLQRERISIPGVPYTGWVADGIGYIRHSDFTEGCYEDMRAAVEKLRTEGELKGLILDYRSNGGGIMQEAIKILGMFVPKGTEVVSTKGRTEDSRRVYRTESEPILPDLPLAVLINGNSASASEIVTGALQDLDRAVIIGQRSYGKGLVQTPRPLGYNAMLKLTTAKYYIPSGRCIQAIDYSHSQEGTVRSVPDSLISEYTTRAGRKVYDGGGIMPDIRTEPEYISRFAMTLYALGFIEDFGDEYVRRHPGQQIDIRTFSITDGDYAEFAEFMKDKEVPYESDTRRALKKLREAAKTDRFEEVEQQIAAIDSTLRDDTATNLETYRKEIVESINNDIVLRHGYSEGVIEHSLPDDGDVLKAIEILGNRQEYARIVTEQDTPRK